MKRIAYALLASALFSVPALAKEDCHALSWVKKALGKDAAFTALTPGQTNFVRGAYTAMPPIGLPPGNAAMLVEIGGHDAVIWLKGSNLVCGAPMPINEPFAKALKGVKSSEDEDVL